MTDDLDLNDGAQSEPQLGMDFVSEVWHRRKRLFIWVASGVLLAAVIIASSLPDLYRASAKVIVDRQEVSEAFVEPSVTADLETRTRALLSHVDRQGGML